MRVNTMQQVRAVPTLSELTANTLVGRPDRVGTVYRIGVEPIR